MKQLCRILSVIVMIVLVFGLFGCAKTPVDTTPSTTAPAEIPFTPVAYDPSEDAPFLPRDIYSETLYVPGIVMNEEKAVLEVTEQTDTGVFVLKGEFGKCYEVKVPAGVPQVRAVAVPEDPRELSLGEKGDYSAREFLKDVQNPGEETAFMYVCRKPGEYLVVSTGTAHPIYIGQRSILEETDTNGPWYVPAEPVAHIVGGSNSFGNFMWNSEEFVNNIYEPYREKYPQYITRTTIGKDDTGKYDMYCYIFAPKDYEITVFLSGGMHADEQVAYYALGKIMQLIADATPEDAMLYTLRQKVRFMVVPIINVYGASHGATRVNGRQEDLNRNFDDMSQQESRNMIALFEPYADEVSFFIDFHTAVTENVSMWYNYINYADNAVANFKTNNHMYHRLLELGHAVKETDLSHVPGSYVKSNQYMEGRIWNDYGVPFLTVEHMTNRLFPAEYSSDCMTLAVETFANFIIQNSLFYLQNG